MKIECLRAHVRSGTRTFPIYMGFAKAEDIARVAVAPAFTPVTANQQIAENISSTPVKDWQRPLASHRVDAIADAFSDTGAVMANPVLLAKNAFFDRVTVAPHAIGSSVTNTFIVTIDETPGPADQRALWVLDGQHRIGGLSQSAQRENMVPLVLLLNDNDGGYSSPDLARIFAQVTTAAEKLDDLHNEWLTFAFSLGSYAEANTAHDAARKAFRSVIELCRTPDWNGFANPFFNRVQFNTHLVATSADRGGFAFRCKDLAHTILRYYYNRPPNQPHLDPAGIALEIAKAYVALHESINGHDSSVYFGTASHQQVIMQDAYLAAVLSRTLSHGVTADYKVLLQSLNFHLTNWDFSTWTRNLSAKHNTTSRRIATRVLEDAFTSGALPQNSNSLVDYLRGNAARVELAFSRVNSNGRPSSAGRVAHPMISGSTTSIAAGTHPNVRLANSSSNIGEVVIHNQDTPLVKYPEVLRGAGRNMQPSDPRPFNLLVVMNHYGGVSNNAFVQINW